MKWTVTASFVIGGWQRLVSGDAELFDAINAGIGVSPIAEVLVRLKERPMEMESVRTWYGPHACEVCGVTIIKAAREDGGAEFEPPERLMRVYRRGSESADVDLVYPMTWKPHVHDMEAAKNWPAPTSADAPPSLTPTGS